MDTDTTSTDLLCPLIVISILLLLLSIPNIRLVYQVRQGRIVMFYTHMIFFALIGCIGNVATIQTNTVTSAFDKKIHFKKKDLLTMLQEKRKFFHWSDLWQISIVKQSVCLMDKSLLVCLLTSGAADGQKNGNSGVFHTFAFTLLLSHFTFILCMFSHFHFHFYTFTL